VIQEGSGRLDLARWIASPENPLTARVIVNRIWQHHFGEGIVRTPNNYGKLGTPPTHPELLDFLAHRFIEDGWSIKSMHRRIMLSAAYQQSSMAPEATLHADPENKLFGRMNRQRFEAEIIRDSLLSAADRLDPALGGPAIRELDNTRRSVYLMTIRSDRNNYRSLFDAADPNSSVDRRIESTVAPQALFLLNNPFVDRQVQSLADRVTHLSAPTEADRIQWLYQQLYSRPARPEELHLAELILQDKAFDDPAVKWEAYCRALVCANEFIYVD
jgi:hypothetical protein